MKDNVKHWLIKADNDLRVAKDELTKWKPHQLKLWTSVTTHYYDTLHGEIKFLGSPMKKALRHKCRGSITIKADFLNDLS